MYSQARPAFFQSPPPEADGGKCPVEKVPVKLSRMKDVTRSDSVISETEPSPEGGVDTEEVGGFADQGELRERGERQVGQDLQL